MSVFDITTPAGSEAANLGDDRIRELKSAIQDALRGGTTEGTEAIFPGAVPSSAPVFRYRGLKGATASRPVSGQYGFFFDTTRMVLQRDNGSSWDDVATAIPAGTVMVFYQSTAPTGWTKVVTQDDKALRVVSGTGGGVGGSQGLSSSIAITHTHTVASHTHTIAHKHLLPIGHSGATIYLADSTSWGQGTFTLSKLAYQVAGAGFGPQDLAFMYSADVDTANTGAATPLTDSQLTNFTLAYIDVILCSKD